MLRRRSRRLAALAGMAAAVGAATVVCSVLARHGGEAVSRSGRRRIRDEGAPSPSTRARYAPSSGTVTSRAATSATSWSQFAPLTDASAGRA
jgi:hypothetical protein